METYKAKFEYGFGGIGDVIAGKVKRVDSLDELDVGSSGLIIRPKLIGVYQSLVDTELMGSAMKGLDDIAQIAGLSRGYDEDETCPDLICVGYDSTIVPLDVLNSTFVADTWGRVKRIEYHELDSIDFYDKQRAMSAADNSFFAASCDSSDANLSALEAHRYSLGILKEDYGLTRLEMTTELAMSKLLEIKGRKASILLGKRDLILGRFLIGMSESGD